MRSIARRAGMTCSTARVRRSAEPVSRDVTWIEAALRRDRAVLLAGLGTLTLLAWVYLFLVARDMRPTGSPPMAMAMPQMQSWGVVELLLLLAMWTAMMVAMMVPSAAPLILLFARADRQKTMTGTAASAAMLIAGYLIVWTGFSVLATLATWGLLSAALLSPMLVSTSSILGGALLVAAGVFQLTSLKNACLTRCRSPMSFLMAEWRNGQWGAFVMGLKHGAYCVGCCWMLMALLFVAGVMNLLWVAAIAAFVLIEKVAPKGELIGRAAGVVLIMVGGALFVG
jgi:predicted metal-binding membrane protein